MTLKMTIPRCYFCGLALHGANPSICTEHQYGHCATHSNTANRCPICEQIAIMKENPVIGANPLIRRGI